MLRPDMEPVEFLGIFSRRKWLIVFSILFILSGVIVYCAVAPDIYKSSATILVIPQRVPEKFVSSTVTYGVEERLAATSRQILSRTRLMQVIDEVGLYKEERKATPPEVLAEKMRDRIEIQIHGARDSKDSFVLSFEHEDPKLAMLTASRLASFFIDENLKVREQLAVGTSEFLDTQVEEVKKQLEVQEEKVKQYKQTVMGELPQQMGANLGTLSRLQDQRRTNAEAIARAEDRKLILESQLQNQISTLDGGGGENAIEQLLAELFTKRKQLEDLSARYTPNYPTVVQLRRAVQQLEENIAKIESGGRVAKDNNTSRSGPSFPKGGATREQQELNRLRTQVRSLELDIQALKREKAEIEAATKATEEKVSRLPQREQEMITITRDYDNLRRSYDDLLKKKLEATVSQNLEERQKGEQFQILDPPSLPMVPFKPDRKKILMIGFFAALACGFGGAIGVEMLDPRLRGMRDFRHFFEQTPVLASIPIIQDARYARRNAMRRAAVLGGILSFMGLFIGIVWMFGERFRTILQF